MRSAGAWLPDSFTRLVASLQQTVDASNPCCRRKVHATAFLRHTPLTDIFLIRIASACEIFVLLFFTEI